jgi:hypothetical protein
LNKLIVLRVEQYRVRAREVSTLSVDHLMSLLLKLLLLLELYLLLNMPTALAMLIIMHSSSTIDVLELLHLHKWGLLNVPGQNQITNFLQRHCGMLVNISGKAMLCEKFSQ